MRWIAVVGLLLATASLAQGFRADGSDSRLDGCEDASWTGFHNSPWGMRFVIPEGLLGLRNSPACTYHGVIIPLSRPPYEQDRHIDLFAGYDTFEGASARETCEALMEGGDRVVAQGTFTLDGLTGHLVRYERGAFTIERRCFLRDGSRASQRYAYTFTLVTPTAMLPEDQRKLASMLESFAWTPPKR